MLRDSPDVSSLENTARADNLNHVFWLTFGYFFIELAGGLYYNSLALVTDASFMAINLLGQLLGRYARRLSGKPPDQHMSFGYERAKVLSGLFNGVGLGFMLFYVVVNAYQRIVTPQALDVDQVLYIAAAGLLVNLYNLRVLRAQAARDLNVRGVFLLILNDALGSVGVIASALIIKLTGLYIIDAFTSLLIGALIAYPTYRLIDGSIHILMESSPPQITIAAVSEFILSRFPEVTHVKDVHVWAIVPEKVLLLARLRTAGDRSRRDRIRAMKSALTDRFGFYDVYLEVYEDSDHVSSSREPKKDAEEGDRKREGKSGD